MRILETSRTADKKPQFLSAIKNRRLKILEVCTFSSGGCGVYARVQREATLLAKKGHKVHIFTTNKEKGTCKTVALKDRINEVDITRFPTRRLGGESFTYWNFTKEAKTFHPDLIIVHSYRHTHTTQALKIAKKLKCKIFLVTHAPFNRDDTRTFTQKWIVKAYDTFIGRSTLNKFDKVLAISKWEIPYLLKLGLEKEDIVYSPNGLPEEFFKTPIKQGNKEIITYTGRIAPIKNLEVVLQAFALTKNKQLQFHLLGPAEPAYKKKLLALIQELVLEKRVKITDQRYTLKEQIAHLEKGALFILPSHSEGMPQVLIEALARKRIVIASDIPASRDIIQNNQNGFLFNKDNPQQLAQLLDKISYTSTKEKKKLQKNAAKSVQQFNWNILIDKIDRIVKSK